MVYTPNVVVDAGVPVDTSRLQGKTVIITGAGAGLGKAYAKEFVKAGAFVTVGDINGDAANAVVSELGDGNAVAVTCDVRSWEDQVRLFETALSSSPSKKIDIVIANAGLGGANDTLMREEDLEKLPEKPDLKVIDVNISGVLYTTRLATHIFKRQRKHDASSEGCLILMSSIAGYIDWPKSRQYPASKSFLRDLMKCMRYTAVEEGFRVNVVAPGFCDTGIIPAFIKEKIVAAGMEFAKVEDAVTAIMRLSADSKIHGRTIGILARSAAPAGYIDLGADDLQPGQPLYDLEQIALNIKF